MPHILRFVIATPRTLWQKNGVMPRQPVVNRNNPQEAARSALRVVTEAGSERPLLDAAELLLDLCSDLQTASPEWAEFLSRLDAVEMKRTLRAAARRSSRLQVVPAAQ